MKKTALAILCAITITSAKAQTINPNHKFPPQELKADLLFVKTQLFNAHADPFSELSKPAYEKLFDSIGTRLTDSMTATAFFKTIKPAVAYLSDEHAQISIKPALQSKDYAEDATFLPFNITQKGNLYTINDQLQAYAALHKGDAITAVNGEPVAALLARCANYSVGFPAQRQANALSQFGYLYTISSPKTLLNFNITTANGKTISIKGTTFKTWQSYVLAKAGQNGNQDRSISYTHYGNTGYINAPAFDARSDKDLDSIRQQIAGIFKQVKADGVKRLFIDVSKNGGGNSSVGEILIDYFCSKPYRGYQCNWKRSDEYVALAKSWGITNDFYNKQPVGKVIHFDSDENKPGNNLADRFAGRVYIMVGNGTFSSAIMFATTVKDNHLATLIGQIPANGHPNHFGELYATSLPNTRLDMRFGVKEWIRPNGKSGENILQPDMIVDLDKPIAEIIKSVK